MAKKEISYTEAYEELESIIAKIENSETDIDELALLVERANYLVKYCETKLLKVESEIKKSFDGHKEDVD